MVPHLTHSGARPYHRGILRNLRPSVMGAATLAVAAALALMLASCATAPKAPPAVTGAPAQPAPANVLEPAALPEEPIVAAEIAVEPMRAIPPPEPPVELATGGDPDSVTNATLQLRSEYGDLWTRIRLGFILDDLDTPLVKNAEDWYAARPDYVARMVVRSRWTFLAEIPTRNL